MVGQHLAEASDSRAGRPMECTGRPSRACSSAGARWSCPKPGLPEISTLGRVTPASAILHTGSVSV